jgi:hypothetical protein
MDLKKQTGEDGDIVRNKAHLVAQEFSQVEDLDFGRLLLLLLILRPLGFCLPLLCPRNSNSIK